MSDNKEERGSEYMLTPLPYYLLKVKIVGWLCFVFSVLILFVNGICFDEGVGAIPIILFWALSWLVGAYLLCFVRLCKDDFIRVDGAGLTIEVHDRSLFPKRCSVSYKWSELSSFDMIVGDDAPTFMTLELYGTDGDLLGRFNPELLFALEELLYLDYCMMDYIWFKSADDYNERGGAYFPRKKGHYGLVSFFFFFFSLLLFSFSFFSFFWTCVSIVLFLSGLWRVYLGVVSRKDCIVVDAEGIGVDLHTTFMGTHIKKRVESAEFGSYSVEDNCRLRIWDREGKELLNCDCSKFSQIRRLDLLLKLILCE